VHDALPRPDHVRDYWIWPSGFFLNADSSLVVANANDDGFVVMSSTRSEAVDVSAPGNCVAVASRDPHGADITIEKTGTSFATPLASSALALIRARGRDLGLDISAREARRRLLATARPMSGHAVAEGAGLIQVGLAVRSLDPPEFFVWPRSQVFFPIDDLDVSWSGEVLVTARPASASSNTLVESYHSRRGSHEGPAPIAQREVGSLFSAVVSDRLGPFVYVPRVDDVLVLDLELAEVAALRLPEQLAFAMPAARPEVGNAGDYLYVPFIASVSGQPEDDTWHLAVYWTAGSAAKAGMSVPSQAGYSAPLEDGERVTVRAIAPPALAMDPFQDVVFFLEDIEEAGGITTRVAAATTLPTSRTAAG
jgi:hypothetical protein